MRVHPQILQRPEAAAVLKRGDVWKRRFREINDWEHYLTDNGFRFVKIFLNLSQRGAAQPVPVPDRRARQELEVLPPTTSRSAPSGTTTSGAFSDVLSNTSTEWAPWYVIPADDKPFARVAAAAVLADTLIEHRPQYPKVSTEAREALQAAKVELEAQAPDGAAPDPYAVEVATKAEKAGDKAEGRQEGRKKA